MWQVHKIGECMYGIYLARNETVVNSVIELGVEAAAVQLVASQVGLCSLEPYSNRVMGNRFFPFPKSSSPVPVPI